MISFDHGGEVLRRFDQVLLLTTLRCNDRGYNRSRNGLIARSVRFLCFTLFKAIRMH